MQNDSSECINPYLPRKCFASNHVIGAKTMCPRKRTWAKLTRLQAGLMTSLKPMLSRGPFAGWVSQMIPFSDWPKPIASPQKELLTGQNHGCEIFL
uniref:Uncharacterized protein n=1 Tax=Piliocolobus tephrosceles TaxID=591936 RepID=A0A8C9HBH7_9PRIM